jgi:hypothetical protein
VCAGQREGVVEDHHQGGKNPENREAVACVMALSAGELAQA